MRRVIVGMMMMGLSTGCSGPMGKIGLDPDVIGMLTRDTAAWCVTIEGSAVMLGALTIVKVTYWRDNAPERGMSDMRHCTGVGQWDPPEIKEGMKAHPTAVTVPAR